MAWCTDRSEDYGEVDFYLTTGAVHFLDASQFLDLADKVAGLQDAAGQPFAMVIVDTLNRNFGPGDENRTDDMTTFVSGMDAIRKITGGAVVVVHHTGLADSTRARGSSALRASLDTELEVNRASSIDPVRLLVRKQKDADEGPPKSFNLDSLIYANDPDDGTPIGSAVLHEVEDTPPEATKSYTPKDGSPKGIALALLKAELAHVDKIKGGVSDDPKVDIKEFKNKYITACREAKNKNPQGAYNDLLKAGYFREWTANAGSWYLIMRELLPD